MELLGLGYLVVTIIVACVILSKTKGGGIGCVIAAIVFIGLFVYTCADMQREEKEREEWNRRFEEKIRMKDSIWREYSNSLPENYHERKMYLEEGKDSVARKIRDRALKEIDEMP